MNVTWSLKFKLIILISLLLVAMGSVISVILPMSFRSAYEDQLRKQGLALVSSLAQNNLFAISTEDASLLNLAVKTASNEADVTYVVIVNKDRKVLAHSDRREAGKILNDSFTERAFKSDEPIFFLEEKGSKKFYDFGSPVIFTGSGIDKGKRAGIVRLGLSLKNLDREAKKFTMVTFSVVGVLIALGVVISWIFAGMMINPLERMTDFAVQISHGNFTERIQIATNDEIGVLAQAFSEMSVSLKKVMEGFVHGIRDCCNQISTSSQELSVSSQKMSSNCTQAERLGSQVSSASEQTNQNVRTVASASEEMSATLKEISENVQDATRMTSDAVTVVESATAAISKLEESTVEIEKIVKMITSIAQQTDLLALNAAIEASRAGGAGKGFSVVANEVKSLARETAKATEAIRQRIGSVQSDTTDVVSAVRRVSKVINQIDKISTKISQALEEQTATTNEISKSMVEAARGIGEIAENIGGVVHISRNTAEAARNIGEASQNLARMGSDLMSMIGNVKV